MFNLNVDTKSWHIEPTSKCILECPLCDRTWFYKKFKKRETHEINLNDLFHFFKEGNYNIELCGNNGDPIYHSDFHNLCMGLKKLNCKIKIITNGSKKSQQWWEKLSKILDVDDTVVFSIDGLEDTNKIYRKNSDWKSIIEGFNIIKTNVRTEWKFIVFKHNQNQIKKAESLSKKLGFDFFRLERSNRWWMEQAEVENLMPDQKYINPSYKHQNNVVENKSSSAEIKPKCLKSIKKKTTNNLYIDSAGNFYPCCWTGLYAFRHKDIFDPKLKKFNIKNKTVFDILENSEVQNFFSTIKDYDSASKCCKIYCGVSNG